MKNTSRIVTALGALGLISAIAAAAEPRTQFLVVAPDRGFYGNRTIEARFSEYREAYPEARLFFMTERLQRDRLEEALDEIAGNGRTRLVILPVLVSEADRGWRSFLDDLEAVRGSLEEEVGVELRPPFGTSAAALRILRDHTVEALRGRPGAELVVVGSRAHDVASEAAIRENLERLVASLGLAEADHAGVEVLYSGHNALARERNGEVYERIAARPEAVVVPFFFDFRADAHMSVEAGVRRGLGSAPVPLSPVMPDEHPSLADWMRRESARSLPPTKDKLGVVLLAHGSDRVWNEEIRRALEPVGRTYDVEHSFNMADRMLVEDAVRDLEARGRTHIVVYRLFGLASSFEGPLEAMIAPEIGAPRHAGHGAHGPGAAPVPISSKAHVVTFGGIEDHPLFAEALLARAEAASGGDRSREVVLLVAHGAGSEQADAHWRSLLASLGRQMQSRATPRFHDVLGATLREDWPEAREAALAEIEALVRSHRAEGRRVLAVEARLNGPGPTASLLEALELLVDDEGFVPHPGVSQMVLDDLAEYLEAGSTPRRFSRHLH